MIEIKIGKPTSVPTYIDTFEIFVKYMHGDADAYSSHSHFYSPENKEDMEMDLLALHFMSNSPYTDIYDARKERAAIMEFFENHGKTKEEALSFIDRFFESDSTCDGVNAAVEGVNVYYWNDDSVKHDVEVKIDERPL